MSDSSLCDWTLQNIELVAARIFMRLTAIARRLCRGYHEAAVLLSSSSLLSSSYRNRTVVWRRMAQHCRLMGIADETVGLCHRISNCSAPILAYTLQEGRTPLHHASKAGKEAAVAVLLEAKADVNLTDEVRRIAIGEYRCRSCSFD